MKILFITRKYPPQTGGMEKYIYNLIKYFPAQKKVIKLSKPQYHLFWFIPYAIILGLIKARKVDLVYISDPVMSIVGWIIKKLTRKPIICTLYGLDLTYSNLLYQLYLRLFAKKFSLYICISHATEMVAHQQGIHQTKVIPVGIETTQILPSPTEIEKSKEKILKRAKWHKTPPLLLTVGRLVKRKGVYWFIKEVMPYLRNCLYLVVGEGPEEKRIKTLIQKKHLEKNVLLLGKISQQDLAKMYVLSNLFIMPNIKVKGDMEGFGIVALEAGLYRLPVIAAEIEGIKDAIKNYQNGVLLQSGDKKDFLQVIKKFLHNEQLRQELGERARKFVIQQFAWEKIAQRYKEELEKISPPLD